MAEGSPAEDQNLPKEVLLFRAAISSIFRDAARSVSLDEFVNNFTILKQTPKRATKLYESLVDHMYENMVGALDDFIKEDNLAAKLVKLRKLSEEATTPEDYVAWRPPGNVDDHLRTMDAQIIAKHTRELEEFVNVLDAENEQLMRQVSEGRASLRLVDQQLDRILNREKYIITNFKNTVDDYESRLTKFNSWE